MLLYNLKHRSKDKRIVLRRSLLCLRSHSPNPEYEYDIARTTQYVLNMTVGRINIEEDTVARDGRTSNILSPCG